MKIDIKIGSGLMNLLTLGFVVLKLCGKINWSWVWVLCPTWGSMLVFLVVLVAAILWTK